MLVPSYSIITSSKCSHLANPPHAFIHIYTGSDYFCCFSPSSFQFINIYLFMANSHLQQPCKIRCHLTEKIVLNKTIAMQSKQSLPPLLGPLFLSTSTAAAYLFIQPSCDLDPATNQAKNNPAKQKKKRFFLMQTSFPIQFTTRVHTLSYQLIGGIPGDCNNQQKSTAAVQNSTARKGYDHEAIQSSCEKHLTTECLELHFIACPEIPAL